MKNAAFRETEYPFSDRLALIDMSPAGHQIKQSTCQMKSFIAFVLRKSILRPLKITFVYIRAATRCLVTTVDYKVNDWWTSSLKQGVMAFFSKKCVNC